MNAARELVSKGVRIIDLAADFRLKDAEEFKRWYKLDHACPELLAEAVYGQPETMREAMKTARVVGMAGCYPTSIELGLAPLMAPLTSRASLPTASPGFPGPVKRQVFHSLPRKT